MSQSRGGTSTATSARQAELERLYNARKTSRGHNPHISISDDSHHVTEAIGSYYDDRHDGQLDPVPTIKESRPLSFMNSPSEVYDSMHNSSGGAGGRSSRRGGGIFDGAGAASARSRPERKHSQEEDVVKPVTEKSPTKTTSPGSLSPKSARSVKRMGSIGDSQPQRSPPPMSPPPLSRQGSSETAIQQFPLNDIDYESSPAAVAQELSNLQAIRRMSMNVDTADPDLPSFGGASIPTVAPKGSEDSEDDASRLFWVPARLHPELAPKEFKTFLEERVDKIRRRSGDSDSLSVDGLERASSGSSLARKKSMLSHQIDTSKEATYEDGADRLERKRSMRTHVEGQATVANLSDLGQLVNDPVQLMRSMSLDPVRRSLDSGIEVPTSEDMPILPGTGQTLKRSTRTTYRRGSLKKGERVPFSKRAQQRQTEPSEAEDVASQAPMAGSGEGPEPILGLTRVQTEPISYSDTMASESSKRKTSRRKASLGPSLSSEYLASEPISQHTQEPPPGPAAVGIEPSGSQSSRPNRNVAQPEEPEAQVERPASPQLQQQPPPPPPPQTSQQRRGPQPRQFQSRLASGGRTTAQLPGYNNQNPLPHIIETLPDGTKVPVGPLAQQQQYPERKSSHELPRPMQRGGAHMRPVPGRQAATPSSTLDDISSHPSPLPGSGSTRTDALTMVPTFEDRKVDKKDSSRKSSWKWILGSDDDGEKEKKAAAAREEKALDGGLSKTKISSQNSSASNKLAKTSSDRARLDLLQASIDGNSQNTAVPRGRESLVLNRADIQLEDERKKETSKKTSTAKEKEPGLLSAIFGGKKKSSADSESKDKKRKSDRRLSPDPTPPVRVLKPDIDYNWTRFSILEERAIYRMAHMKLANPRRALYSQVLLSNFMYSYLAKVQMMHPQHMPGQQPQTRRKGEQQQQQPAEYSQYQRWQEAQARQEAAAAQHDESSADRAGSEQMANGSQQQDYSYHAAGYDPSTYEAEEQYSGADGVYNDRHSSEEYENSHYMSTGDSRYSTQSAPGRLNGVEHGGGGGAGGGAGYSVASTHDYLGYAKNEQPFGQDSLWENEKPEELW